MTLESNELYQERGSDRRQRRRSVPWLLGGLVLFLLAIMVVLQVAGLWSILPPDSASDTLLLYALSSLNFAAFIVFAFILVRSLVKLRRERREHMLGSKIKTRLLIYLITLSLLPIAAMAVFSYLFLNRSIEKFFWALPEGVVSEAQQLQREAEASQKRSLGEITSAIALMIEQNPEGTVDDATLTTLAARANLASLQLLTIDGQVIAKSSPSTGDIVRCVPPKGTGESIAAKVTDNSPCDIVSISLASGRQLVAGRIRPTGSNLGEIISGSQGEYAKLVSKQRKVRLLGLSTLGLLTLMLVFASTWTAIHLARGIATPIQALAEASNEVARGNLSHRVTTIADDELALLAGSFNQMTAQLEENRRRIERGATELQDKNLALEERRHYIETVLESLSTGVVSVDENERVTTLNAAAMTMLRLQSIPNGDFTLSEITSPEDRLVLTRLLNRARRMGRATEQTEIVRGANPENEAVPVALTANALRGPDGETRGAVLVLEDLTELLSAQRAAAWSEVARRMAHEIKNPLTPIQLSAERIARTFKRSTNGDSANGSREERVIDKERVAQVVDECTSTITREVAGLKAMVDEFSRFARLPHARPEAADLNEVVSQAVSLYEDRLYDTRVDVHLARSLPVALLDAEQMRRVFVNLMDNALEALAEIDGERRITIATGHDPARGLLLVEIADTGHGIQPKDIGRLFQPYFSTRRRGTGLGLAIVQRIIIEHGGRIRAEANHPRGAKFVIQIPATNV